MIVSLPEPSVGAIYGHAWRQLRKYFVPLLLVGIVVFAIQMIGNFVIGVIAPTSNEVPSGLNGVLSMIFTWAVMAPLNYGSVYVNLKAARDTTPGFDDLFTPFRRNYMAAIISSFVVTIIVIIGLILLIVPGIYAAIRLSFVPFLVVDEGMEPMAALRESWERTNGYAMTIFGAFLLAVPMVFVGLLLFIIGIIPAMMLVSLAYATLFASVTAARRGATGRVAAE